MGPLNDPPADATAATLPFAAPDQAADIVLPDRYAKKALLGRGGMADILLARDLRLYRDVALKAGHNEDDEDAQRFVREAHLQGQLEHPAIVPVYDIGELADGAPFFTMKRVRGSTLDEVVGQLARKDPLAESKFTRPRLLAAFVTVAQSVHYAHARGVVHRDLKPANIMVGDFGEVYVLDWGIAKLLDAEATAPSSPRSMPSFVHLEGAQSTVTRTGELLGTLGYMPPEQITDAPLVDERADVYALGAILFELLTLQKLNPGARAVDILESTMAGTADRVRAALSAGTLSPELAEVCERATHSSRDARYRSVSDIIDAIQRYLDGDRDLEARAKMADEEAQRAIASLERQDRPNALKHAGRALALDPGHPDAQRVIVSVMVEPAAGPALPEEVESTVEREWLRLYRRGARAGAFLFAPWLVLAIALCFGDVHEPFTILLWIGSVLFAVASLIWNARAPRRSAPRYFIALFACLLAPAVSTRFIGAYSTVPGVITMTVVVFILLGRRTWQWPTIAVGAIALGGPTLLERAGLLSVTTRVDDDAIHIASPVVSLTSTASLAALTFSLFIVYFVVSGAAGYFQRLLLSNTRRAALQTWKLHSLAPADTRALSEIPPSSKLP